MAQSHISFLNAVSFQILKLKTSPGSTAASQQRCNYAQLLFGPHFYATAAEMDAFLKSKEAWSWRQKGYSDYESSKSWSECADIAAQLGATNLDPSFRIQSIMLL